MNARRILHSAEWHTLPVQHDNDFTAPGVLEIQVVQGSTIPCVGEVVLAVLPESAGPDPRLTVSTVSKVVSMRPTSNFPQGWLEAEDSISLSAGDHCMLVPIKNRPDDIHKFTQAYDVVITKEIDVALVPAPEYGEGWLKPAVPVSGNEDNPYYVHRVQPHDCGEGTLKIRFARTN